MLKILLFILGMVVPMPKGKKPPKSKETLEQEVRAAEKKMEKEPTPFEKKTVEHHAEKIDKEYATARQEKAPQLSLGERLKSMVRNVGNIATNAFDNTVGNGIAAYQNSRAAKDLAKNPDKDVVYLMHGFAQSKGAQWRLAKELKKRGVIAYHVAGQHHLDDQENLEQTYGQIQKLHKKAGVKDASKRNDVFSGHSSGGDMAIYMAGDGKANQYGIKHVEARAPAPTGIKAATFGQKLLMPFVSKDNVDTYRGRARAVNLDKRVPKMPVHVVAGKQDRLVRPQESVYKHASTYTVVDHPDSTHFGTSGSNKNMNRMTADRLATIARQKEAYTGSFGHESSPPYNPSAQKAA